MQSGIHSGMGGGARWLDTTIRIGLSPLFWILLVLVCLLVTSCGASMFVDESIWGYSGWLWVTHHLPPYVGIVDDKGPGIFLIHAASVRLFGVGYLPTTLLGIATILAASFAIYRFAMRLKDRCAGIFAMAVFGLSLSAWWLNGEHPALTETFMVFFTILAFFLLAGGRPEERFSAYSVRLFLAGASMGLAITFKQIALADAVALFLIWLFVVRRGALPLGQRMAGGAVLLVGLVLAMFLCFVPFLLSGCTLTDYWNGTWAILTSLIARETFASRIDGFFRTWTEGPLVLFIPLLVAFPFLTRKSLLRENNLGGGGILVWLLFCFLGVNSSGSYYGHQVRQVLPPLALVAGITLSEMVSRLSAVAKGKSPATALVLAGVLAALFPYKGVVLGAATLTFPQAMSSRPGVITHAEAMQIAAWIKEHTRSTDPIYVWSRKANLVLYPAERMSSSVYLNTGLLRIVPHAMDRLREDLNRRPPRLFLVRQDPEPDNLPMPEWLGEMLEREYRQVYQADSYTCFQRRPAPERPSSVTSSSPGLPP